jgi:hypothetical protein
MRLSSLKKRFKELCALDGDDKKEAVAIMSQRARIVRDARACHAVAKQKKSARQQRPAENNSQPAPPPPGPLSLCVLQHSSHSHTQPPPQREQRVAVKHATKHKQSQSRPRSLMAARQSQWMTALAHVRVVLSLKNTIQRHKMSKAEALKQRAAVLIMQKFFRWKLMPHYVRQLVKAVATLKPWMTDALARWRQRRLHRSADILRQTLINSMQTNKITLCIRAFRQKVVRLQRNIRSFLLCTRGRVIRLLKLLHIQVPYPVPDFAGPSKLILESSV